MVPGRIAAFSLFWDQDKLQNGRTEMRLQLCESRLIYLQMLNRRLKQWYTQMNTHSAPPHAGPIALQIDCNVIDIPLAAPL